jgi:hypothetical protein
MIDQTSIIQWLSIKILYLDTEYDLKLIDKGEFHKLRKEAIKEAEEMMYNQRISDVNNGYSQGYDDGIEGKEPMRPEYDFKE